MTGAGRRAVGAVAVGVAVASVVRLARLAALAQLLDLDQVGGFVLGASLVVALDAALGAGVERVLVQRPELAAREVDVFFTLNVGRAAAVSLACLGLAAVSLSLLPLALVPLARALAGPHVHRHERALRMGTVALFESARASLAALGTVAGLAVGLPAGDPVAGAAGGTVVGHLAAAAVAWRWFGRPRWATPCPDELRRWWSDGRHFARSGVATVVMARGDDLLVGFVLGPSGLAVYALAYELVELVLAFVRHTVGRLAFGTFARASAERSTAALGDYLVFGTWGLALLVATLAATASAVVSLTYGPAFAEVAGVVGGLSLLAMARGFVQLTAPYLIARGLFGTEARGRWVEAAGFVGGVGLGALLGGVQGAAIGAGAGYLGAAVLRVGRLPAPVIADATTLRGLVLAAATTAGIVAVGPALCERWVATYGVGPGFALTALASVLVVAAVAGTTSSSAVLRTVHGFRTVHAARDSSDRSSPEGRRSVPPAAVGLLSLVPVAWLGLRGGYVSPDSSRYLAAAHAWASRGILVDRPPFASAYETAWTTWPPLYPLVVGALARASGITPWLASKMVGLVALVATVALLSHLVSPRDPHGPGSHRTRFGLGLLPAALWLPSALRTFTYSWSEVLFIPATLGAVGLMRGLAEADTDREAVGLAGLLMLCLGVAFGARYIGVCLPLAVLVCGVAWRLPRAWAWGGAAVGAWLLAFAHLAANRAVTGSFGGAHRGAALESWGQLVTGLLASVVVDAGPFVLLAGGALVVAWRCAPSEDRRPERESSWIASFALVFGLVYLATLFALRSTRHFDFFNGRLTFPGTLLLLVWAIDRIEAVASGGTRRARVRWRWVRWTGLALTFAYGAGWVAHHVGVTERRLAQRTDGRQPYASLPPSALVIEPRRDFGHVAYAQLLARPDLRAVEVRRPPHGPAEDADAFARRVQVLAEDAASWRGGETRCFVDATWASSRAAMASELRCSGVKPDTVRLLVRHADPGRLREVPACDLR